jgi:hypothetical protein
VKQLSIGHISHGIVNTGGYLLEQEMQQSLSDYFVSKGIKTEKKTVRANRFFKGFGHFKLLWWSFVNARFTINIVVSRSAISAVLRNLFTTNKVVIVFHNFDETDGKGLLLSWYYKLLFLYLSNSSSSKIAIVTVAPFWVDYFQQKVNGNIPVFLFPNLFDTQTYAAYHTQQKIKQIHLGQFSSKNDSHIFDLAAKLSEAGFRCYFTTLMQEEQCKTTHYEVRFVGPEQYLREMAESAYTLAFIGINEGWNRIAHESILVGTQLIGVNKGGLGNLITQSNSLVATNEDEFYALIVHEQKREIDPTFVKRYDTQTAQEWIQPLGLFCES